MKAVMIALICAFLMVGCIGSLTGSITFNKDGQTYNVSYLWNSIAKELSVSLVTGGVEYRCAVIKDADFQSNVAILTDFNIDDLNGGMSITYKGVKYDCQLLIQ